MTYIKELSCHWLANIKLSRIIILVTLTLVVVPIFTHYYLSNVSIDIFFNNYSFYWFSVFPHSTLVCMNFFMLENLLYHETIQI